MNGANLRLPFTSVVRADGDHLCSVAPDSLPALLANVRWDFNERPRDQARDIEALHPYPAKFIAELPRALLSILPLPKYTSVLDPFCGSGTTLVECQRKGISSIGIDLNPIACLIARCKTSPLAPRFRQAAEEVFTAARNLGNPTVPPIPNLDHWFLPSVQVALAALTEAIRSAPESHRDPLRLVLSSIIVRVSNQESDTRYAAVQKSVTADDVYIRFLRAARRIDDVLSARDYGFSPSSRVIEANTLTLPPSTLSKRSVGLVITSPPYPNAYEYWLYHKYRMWWLGYDPIAVKTHEIGARAHFFKRHHHTADNFVRQMEATFRLMKDVIVDGAYACFVVGRSKIHGDIVDNANIIEDVGRSMGFSRVFAAERVLSAKRKSFNLSHANIKTETVLVLRHGGAACV